MDPTRVQEAKCHLLLSSCHRLKQDSIKSKGIFNRLTFESKSLKATSVIVGTHTLTVTLTSEVTE